MMLPEDLAGLAAGAAFKGGMGMARTQAMQRALAPARVALSTGQSQAPELSAAPGRNALRN